MNVFGFGMILPLLPYYAAEFNAANWTIGMLASSYALASIISSPLLGRLSDRYGRRPLMLVSIVGTIAGFVVIGAANALWMLFLGRILDGLTAGNITVAQSYIADITDDKSRARGLGITGAAFGLGFIVGPSAGGLLSAWGYGTAAFVAAGVSVLNLILVAVWLPESLSEERKAVLAAQPRGGVTLSRLLVALRRPRFGPALVLRAVFWFAFAIFQTTFSLWARDSLGASARTTGLILGYVGVLSLLVQLVVIGPLTKRFAEGSIVVVSLAVAAVSLMIWGFTPTVALVFVSLTPLGIAVALQNTTASSLLSKSVKPWEIGGAFGLSNSLTSVGSVVAPLLGTTLLTFSGWAPGLTAGLIALALVPYAYAMFMRDGPTADVATARPATTGR